MDVMKAALLSKISRLKRERQLGDGGINGDPKSDNGNDMLMEGDKQDYASDNAPERQKGNPQPNPNPEDYAYKADLTHDRKPGPANVDMDGPQGEMPPNAKSATANTSEGIDKLAALKALSDASGGSALRSRVAARAKLDMGKMKK